MNSNASTTSQVKPQGNNFRRPATCAEALALAARRLQGSPQGTPRALARALLKTFCNLPYETQLAHPERALDPDCADAFLAAVEAVAQGTPLAYVVGKRAFCDFEVEVAPGVLIPRPETELLVEVVLQIAGQLPEGPFADVGTGSGVLAIALARALPGRDVLALELSKEALEIARRNFARLGVHRQVRALRSDLLSALAPRPLLALVVSNPPYVEATDFAHLPDHIKRYEPEIALVPPEGPENLYRRLARQAFERLLPGGVLVVELGAGQGESCRRVLGEAGFSEPTLHTDLAGIVRVVCAWKSK